MIMLFLVKLIHKIHKTELKRQIQKPKKKTKQINFFDKLHATEVSDTASYKNIIKIYTICVRSYA